jgi:hypothetical protein
VARGMASSGTHWASSDVQPNEVSLWRRASMIVSKISLCSIEIGLLLKRATRRRRESATTGVRSQMTMQPKVDDVLAHEDQRERRWEIFR